MGETMRKPTRIRRIMAKITEIWEMMPDQRLGQLLINLGLAADSRLWQVEDNKWEKHLNKEKLKFGRGLK
jgi:hypothetical protein